MPGLLLGEVVGKEHEEALAHLERCPSCAEEFGAMKRVNGLLKCDEGVAPAAWRRNRAVEAIHAEIQRHAAEPEVGRTLFVPSSRRRLVLTLSAAALVLAAGALGAILALRGASSRQGEATAVLSAARGRVEIQRNAATQWVPAASGEKLMPGDRVATREDSYAKLDFADGYTIDLDSASGIQVGMADPAGKSSVVNFFHGRAWFDVSARHARHGLLIYAPGGVLRVKSARFEVSY